MRSDTILITPPEIASATRSVHACAVVVDGRGVLLFGPPGAGKSRLALALVRAGQPLVSDDMVLLTRIAAGWQAHGPAEWLGKLWVRGSDGPIDVRDTYGVAAVQPAVLLQVAVALPSTRRLETTTRYSVDALQLPTLALNANSTLSDTVACIRQFVSAQEIHPDSGRDAA